MADGVRRGVALAEHLRRAGRQHATCTTTRSRRATRCACGPLGYQGSKAAMKLIAQADVVLALGTRLGPVRHAAAARHRLLAEGRQDHPGRHRPAHARAGEEDRTSASAATPRAAAAELLHRLQTATAASPPTATREARLAEVKTQKAGVGGRARPTGRPARRLADRAAPRAARAREGDAEERHGHDRHRQHLLGRQQLPALRAAAVASSPR